MDQIAYLSESASKEALSQMAQRRYFPRLVVKNNSKIDTIMQNYQRMRPPMYKQLSFEIASIIEESRHFVESQLFFEKRESSKLLDDQERTQAHSCTCIDQIYDKMKQTTQQFTALMNQMRHISQLQTEVDQLSQHFDTILNLIHTASQKFQDCSIQKRFFSQHNSEDEQTKITLPTPAISQPKIQLAYNPIALDKMLQRLKKQKIETKTLFRPNQRLPQEILRASLQYIALPENKSPSFRSLDMFNVRSSRNNNESLKHIQRTIPCEQLSQNTLQFLRQLKKTKSIEAHHERRQISLQRGKTQQTIKKK